MKRRTGEWFLLIVLLVSACSVPTPVNMPPLAPLSSPQVKNEPIRPSQASNQPEPVQTLPQTSAPIDMFGVEINRLDVDFGKVRDLGATWLRYNAIVWSDVEPVEGQYNWEVLAPMEDMLRRASEAGLKTILIVRGTPDWAQAVPGTPCGPVRAEKLSAFASFVSAMVSRYSAAPYQVHYWEVWNEPDVAPELVQPTYPYGCWGNSSDPFYGGGTYAEMLKTVVPAIRQADSQAKVLNGGLLLDCDPTAPGTPGNCDAGKELPPRFFEGMLANGAGELLDYVSYHGYTFFTPPFENQAYAETNFPTWKGRGGVLSGKLSFLRETMDRYGYQIPLFLTETSVLCHETTAECNPPNDVFLRKQAEHGAWLVVRNYAEGIHMIWFTYDGPGWRAGSILDENQNPKPVYQAIQFTLKQLSGSQAVRKIQEYPDMLGYEFVKPDGNFYFLVPNADAAVNFQVPADVIKVMDVFGNEIPVAQTLSVSQPIFIVTSQ